ncbi:glycosyltransferase family 8 protein [Solwaraspora sp. WMMD1047]|uniref:glycosyltransferase family 8 protein n=1 Tax=Solwaraspora sp. WMMD1047 TaxID=3016102 RepID=UPI002417BDBF|nr:glycosyltransferase family 8 protein [Solwaraspora sp. WMMD1047]MDG4834866.1 glycosyltransferase family 8 protein [Solwaraspora sp. WMMD1047]
MLPRADGRVASLRTTAGTSGVPGPSRSLPPIVCGVDHRYALPLTALMRSLAAVESETTEALRIIVLHGGLDSASQKMIGYTADEVGLTLEFRRVTGADAAYPVSGWISDAVYLRLAIADTILDEPRVLYLDADVLVLRDIRPLLSQPLGGLGMGAVRDPQNPIVGVGIALPGWERIGVPRGREYFNSGVLLLDLELCRRQCLFPAATRFLRTYPGEARLWDQDALNVAADDRWTRLERRWNTFVISPLVGLPGFTHANAEPVMPLATLLGDERDAAVLHFGGPLKPWSSGYPAGPMRDLYRRFLDPARERVLR